ncbi:LOW QUALITY PROTEIN: hypothetical protein ACHAW6_011666 [Cyclotella cf. meneghiniana]
MKKTGPQQTSFLAEVDSPFVVSSTYSFYFKDDVFLIIDLMMSGHLSFHLCQKGLFSRKEFLYFNAHIMLCLPAIHDKRYMYYDLKPENCPLSDDGCVQLTDIRDNGQSYTNIG